MGVATPLPPIMICAAAPTGRHRGGSTTDISKKHRTAPPCRTEALRRVTIVIFTFFYRFSWFWCERPFMCVSHENRFLQELMMVG
jgi:hypothetical protein